MAMNLHRRISRLEAGARGECPRCSGVIGVFSGATGELHRASRHGEPMSAEEWGEATEQDGRCPLCGRSPVRINVVEEG